MDRNRYFRSEPLPYGLISLGGYIRFWGVVFILVTVWLAAFKKEDPVSEDDPDMDVKKVYKVMWSIVKLKSESPYPENATSKLTARHTILPDCTPDL